MSFALHRKYRPAKVAELDQTGIRDYFGTILKSGRFGQAYLFAGPKGTGKTSSARILAAVVNCEENREVVLNFQKTGKPKPLAEPCGKCASCKEIRSGSSPAVIEIDGASNRRIDDIRALQEKIGLATGGSVYTVYILDEVHMLTKEAFNALLKTLEEPPAHVIFCLCTTEANKLPETIRSRCAKVRFVKATDEEIVRSLERVVAGEGIEIDNKILGEIAHKSDGSFRDAVMSLSQRWGSEGEQNLELNENETLELVELMLAGKTQEALGKVKEIYESGREMYEVTREVAEIISERLITGVREKGKSDEWLVEAVEVMAKAFGRFTVVPLPSLPLEMAVIELGIKSGKVKQIKATPPEPVKTEPAKQESVKKEVKSEPVLPVKQEVEPEEVKEMNGASVVVEPEPEGVMLELPMVRSGWQELLNLIAKENHGLFTLLKQVQLTGCRGAKIELAVRYRFHKEQLEQDRYLKLLEEVSSKLWGMRPKFVVLVAAARLSDEMQPHENITAAIDPEEERLVEAIEDVFGAA